MPVLQQRAVRCHCQAPIWLNMWKIKEISKNRLDSFGIENWTPQKHLVTRYNFIITSSFVDMTQHVEATTLGMTKPRWHQILEWMCSAAYSILYWFNCKRQHKQANGLRFLLESNTNPFSVLLVVLDNDKRWFSRWNKLVSNILYSMHRRTEILAILGCIISS